MALTPEEIAAEEAEIAAHEKRQEDGANTPPGARMVAGWAIPADDAHLETRLGNASLAGGRATYNLNRLLRALSYCGRYRTAIDVGAHVGFMTYWLRQIFESVVSYEPHPLHAQCLYHNVGDLEGSWTFFAKACGAQAWRVKIAGQTSEKMHVLPLNDSRPGTACDMVKLDDHHWKAVDFLKIDCEGYELEVVKGARETIDKWRPVIMIEQKEGVASKRYGLEELGALKLIREIAPYRMVYEDNGDYVLCPKKESA